MTRGWWPGLLAMLLMLPAAAQNPIGLGQPVAVVVCQYQNSDPPRFSSLQWASALNLHLNQYYQQASAGLTSFDFRPVPGICQLGYPDDAPTTPDAINYLNSVNREGRDAARFAEAAGFDLSVVRKIVVIVNAVRRGNATIGEWPIYDVGGQRFRPLAITAFGEIDQFGNPLLTPQTMAQVFAETNIDVAAHELGHLLGQFDLYPYFPTRAFSAQWSQMGEQTWQHFDGFTRFKYGWLPAPGPRVRDFVMPLTGAINQPVTLTPPTSGVGTELIRISLNPADALTGTPSRPFFGLVIEARPQVGLDANLPDAYEEGVLVSLVAEDLPQASYVVQPETESEDLSLAPFLPSQRYAFDELGVFVEVLARGGNNFNTRVRWQAPQLPDVALDLGTLALGESRDIFLDSPANGFNTFTFPNLPGDNVPAGPGDFPIVPFVIPWNDPDGAGLLPPLPGAPVPQPVTHRIRLRARNIGRALATNVRGNVLILQPTLPNFDPANPAALLDLGTPRTVQFGAIPAGGASTQTVEIQPDGRPFMVLAWLDRVDNEVLLHNQVAGEAFIIFQPAPGSPYDPVTVDLTAANLDRESKVRSLFALPRGVPGGWDVAMSQVGAAARPGEQIPFRLRMQAPERDKPQLVTPVLEGWTDFGDGAVPIGELPVYVDLSIRTRTTLDVKDDGKRATLTGRVSPGRAGLRVTLHVSGSDGSASFVGNDAGGLRVLTTGANGAFSATVEVKPDVSYQAVATFVGAEQTKPSVSPAVAFGKPAAGGGRPRPGRRLIPIADLPRPLRRPFQEAFDRGAPAPASVELIEPGVAIDWSNGRLLADGTGAPRANLTGDRRRATQRGEALSQAFSRLRRAVGSLPVTADTTLDSFAQGNADLKRRLDELVNTYRIVAEEDAEGGYQVTIAINVTGRASLQQHVMPVVPTEARAAAGRLNALPEPRVQLAEQPVEVDFPSRSTEPHTGLIIDCTGLGARRAMAPKIVTADETEVWGTVFLDPEKIRDEGLVGYAPDLDTALASDRIGDNPLVIGAIGLAGRFKANPVVSDEDAKRILEADERGKFLERLRILFVVD